MASPPARGEIWATLAQTEVALEVAGLEPLLDRHEEASRVGAVDDAVVVAQREVDHRAWHDQLAQVRVFDDYRALDYGAGAEDADLRLVDDRRVEQRASAAGVGQRERAAGQLIRTDLVRPGTLRHVGDPL